MQKYAWVAAAPDGRTRKGTVEAVDARAVADWLNREGYTVISVSRVKWPPTNYHVERITRRDLIHFTYKYLPLLASNLAMDRTLEILRGEIKKHRIKNAITNVRRDMHNGSEMSRAMSRHPDVFSTPYVSAVRAGEEAGDLPKSLSMMGAYLEWLDKTVRQVWATIAYPLAVLAAMVILCGVLTFFVMPVFIHLYERLGFAFEMPLPTKIVFNVSTFVRNYWYIGAIIVGVLLLIYLMRRKLPGLRLWMHKMALRLPIAGNMTRQLQALQFCRFFRLLHSSGVNTKRALAEASGVMTNIPMRNEVRAISHRLDQGMTLGESFHHSRLFPSLVSEQIRVGEESGKVDESMDYVIRYYDSELDYSIRRFTGVLGPALVFILAMVLLLLALSFYLPLYEIATMIEPQQVEGAL